MTWTPVTYDPDLNLIFVTTGNPQPVIAHANRAGANLFTGSIVALNADTGVMAWYFQSSPHDTHDWDSTQTAVVFDAPFNGQPRKLIAQAARNGHFFVLDRTNGKALVSTRVREDELVVRLRRRRPADSESREDAADRRHARVAQSGRRDQLAVAVVQPAHGPVLRELVARLQRVLPLRSERQPGGVGRHGSRRLLGVDAAGDRLPDRQDPVDASVEERRAHGPVCPRPGNVLFTGGSGGLEALNASTGDALWHSRIGQVTNAPITFELDGFQYVVAASGGTVFAFVLN